MTRPAGQPETTWSDPAPAPAAVPRGAHGRPLSRLERDVESGLTHRPRSLPPWLFYDAAGSQLFEQITRLPEYYLTRAEHEILVQHGGRLVEAAAEGHPLAIVELGAGTAVKSQVLVEAAIARQGVCTFVPIDVSPAPLAAARERFARDVPRADVRPIVGPHEHALPLLPGLRERILVLFLGSSIGNCTGDEAALLLRHVRRAMRPGDALLLGTDLRKEPRQLLAAYDDAAGVTAAFNRNVLVRINRELGGTFDPLRFRHVALWNEAASAIEMHLESIGPQRAHVRQLGLTIDFEDGERIHTESSAKYGREDVARLLHAADLRSELVVTDERGWFAEHLARR